MPEFYGMSETSVDTEDMAALAAIEVLLAYLDKAWIVPSCRLQPTVGCASCEMVDLERKLLLLAAETRASVGIEGHA